MLDISRKTFPQERKKFRSDIQGRFRPSLVYWPLVETTNGRKIRHHSDSSEMSWKKARKPNLPDFRASAKRPIASDHTMLLNPTEKWEESLERSNMKRAVFYMAFWRYQYKHVGKRWVDSPVPMCSRRGPAAWAATAPPGASIESPTTHIVLRRPVKFSFITLTLGKKCSTKHVTLAGDTFESGWKWNICDVYSKT